MKLFFRILEYIKPYKGQLAAACFCMLIFSLCNLAVMPLVSEISQAVGGKRFHLVNIFIGAAILLFFIKGLFQYGQAYMASFIGQRVVVDMRGQVFGRLQNLSMDFYAEWKTGEVMSRVINDISVIQGAIMIAATEIIPQMLTLFGVLGYLLYLNWRLTLLALLTTPVFIFAITKFGMEMREIGKNTQMKIADLSAILQETITGARVIKSFTMEDQETERFKKEAEDSFAWSMKEAQIDATQKPIMGFLQVLAVVIVIWFGCIEVLSGRLRPSDLLAFFAGAVLLIDPVIVISKINTTLQRALSSAERVFEVMDIKPTVREKENAAALPPIKGYVRFDNVAFSYKSDEMVLKNITVSASPGETLALVGPSGSGKTTFISLLLRFYDPAKGEIYVDGFNIKDVSLFSLRKQTGIVPQETTLFSGTIKDNIKYGSAGASDSEVIASAKAANAHGFIMELPDAYNTQAGERGLSLSGGQRQRIAIARALLKNPRILILDEATSSLDTTSEKLIQDALDNLVKGRTTFVIAHRLSTVQNATRILVLENGQIVEEGGHSELLAKNGYYKKLYDAQFKNA